MNFTAQWIWLQEARGRNNIHLHARKRFTLDALPAHADLAIACAHIYRLFVNGVYIARGPDRSADRFPYYDSHNILAHLKTGENVIAIHAFHVGENLPGRVWPLYDGPGGLLVQLDTTHTIVATDRSWKIRMAPGHLDSPRTAYPHPDPFRGFKEYVDADALDPQWNRPDCDDSAWPHATIVACVNGGPWNVPLPREIPPLQTRRRLPLDVWSRQDHFGAISNAYLLLNDRHAWRGPVQVQLHDPDERASLDLDLGYCMGGFPHLHFSDCAGGQIDLYLGDSFQRYHEARILLPSQGLFEWTGMDWRGGRYLSLEFSRLKGPLTIKLVAFEECGYPFENRGSFESEDHTLNRVWEACRLTAAAGVQDHPVDCMGREQAIWLGDLVVHSRAILACFGDDRPVAKALRQSFRTQRPTGIVPVPGPGDRGYEKRGDDAGHAANAIRWADHALAAVRILRDLVLRSGNLDLARDLLPNCLVLDSLFDRLLNDHHMIENNPAHPVYCHLGWSAFFNPGFAKDHDSTTEILGAQAVRIIAQDAIADLAAWTEQGDLARQYRKAANLSRQRVHQRYFDPERSLYRDGFQACKPVDRYSQIINAHAFLAGILPEHLRVAWLHAFTHDPANVPSTSPFDTSLIAEALFIGQRHDLALDLIRRHHGSMVEGDNLPQIVEYFDPAFIGGDRFRHPDWSRSHPYGTGPAYLFHQFLLGVQPLSPGYASIQIAPVFAGLEHLKATIPLPGSHTLELDLHAGPDGVRGVIACDHPAQLFLKPPLPSRVVQSPCRITL
jgi:hypothetical protein